MKGILFKDFLSAKRILTIYLLMIICFSFGGAKGVFFALCYSIMVPVNLLGFDERSRFDRYASVLPLCMAMMMALSSLIAFIRTGAASAMEDMLLYAATVLATHALCMPLLIRMGVTKGQWVYLLALVAEFGVTAIIGKLGGEGVMERISALALPIFLAALAVNVASMFVAAKMFDRRAEG